MPSKLSKELKGLGTEIAQALREIKKSDEFHQLEKDFARGVKSISSSLTSALRAAGKSPRAKTLRKRMGRVIKEGSKEGKIQAKKAETVASSKIKKARVAIKELSQKYKNR